MTLMTLTIIQNGEREKIPIEYSKLQKMCCFYEALENGWSIQKTENKYIFTKPGCEKKEMKDFLQIHFNKTLEILKK